MKVFAGKFMNGNQDTFFVDHNEKIPCPECEGRGFEKEFGYAICPVCTGYGKVYAKFMENEAPTKELNFS